MARGHTSRSFVKISGANQMREILANAFSASRTSGLSFALNSLHSQQFVCEPSARTLRADSAMKPTSASRGGARSVRARVAAPAAPPKPTPAAKVRDVSFSYVEGQTCAPANGRTRNELGACARSLHALRDPTVARVRQWPPKYDCLNNSSMCRREFRRARPRSRCWCARPLEQLVPQELLNRNAAASHGATVSRDISSTRILVTCVSENCLAAPQNVRCGAFQLSSASLVLTTPGTSSSPASPDASPIVTCMPPGLTQLQGTLCWRTIVARESSQP